MTLLARIRTSLARMKAVNELERLDDRMLNDFGIKRHEIAAAVAGQLPAAQQRSRTAVPARGVRQEWQAGLGLGQAA